MRPAPRSPVIVVAGGRRRSEGIAAKIAGGFPGPARKPWPPPHSFGFPKKLMRPCATRPAHVRSASIRLPTGIRDIAWKVQTRLCALVVIGVLIVGTIPAQVVDAWVGVSAGWLGLLFGFALIWTIDQVTATKPFRK